MSEYTLRKLNENDWQIFKEIRLKALARDPFVFGSTHEAEAERTDEDWREPLRSFRGAIFVIFDGSEAVGITGTGVDRNDPA